MKELTRDQIYGEAITILQHKKGYRFGTDALLLATDLPPFEHISSESRPRVVELGAAHGPVALCVATFYPQADIIALERQEDLFLLLKENIALNALENVTPLAGDLRDFRSLLKPHFADLVLFNPPYFRPGERRLSACLERAEAHHELHGDLGDFIAAARYILKQRGYLKLIVPPLRLPDLFAAIEGTDLRPESLRFFHSLPESDAYLVEIVLRRAGAPDFKIRPPLYIYARENLYTDEVARRLGKVKR